MSRDYPLVIFANLVNELMVTVPVVRHSGALVAVSPRKVWLSRPGDVVVTPATAPEPLWEYACELLGFERSEITSVVALTDDLVPLAQAVRRNGLVEQLKTLAAERPGIRLLPFAQDRPTADLAAELGLPVDGYEDGVQPEEALAAAYRINTKPGFRELAAELGIRTAEGLSCTTPEELLESVRSILTRKGGAVVKPARGSNGYGVLFLGSEDLPVLQQRLAEYLPTVSEQPAGWIVEEKLSFARVVTVEMATDEAGPHVLHVGEMRTPNGSFSGQITPLQEESPAVDELVANGLTLGSHLHAAGYRGAFDIDGGITADGVLYTTESNVRRTGSTYLDLLVQRLLGTERAARAVWMADSRPGGIEPDFKTGLELVREAGLAFERGGDSGVVLTADTLAYDGKWRYLVIAQTYEQAEDIESRLSATLQLR
ncbi:peptide ligase PGM1-related protein [Streptomyces sp. NPDC058401]|uniref:preATP grasp domain-containing protein n=1 Tax=Streptomyces sp. NPDC058401 TaxID=3346480 RepID=UPI003649F8DD